MESKATCREVIPAVQAIPCILMVLLTINISLYIDPGFHVCAELGCRGPHLRLGVSRNQGSILGFRQTLQRHLRWWGFWHLRIKKGIVFKALKNRWKQDPAFVKYPPG